MRIMSIIAIAAAFGVVACSAFQKAEETSPASSASAEAETVATGARVGTADVVVASATATAVVTAVPTVTATAVPTVSKK